MEKEVKKLKLNVTNIKSYLINSNKELKKLRVQKTDLFNKIGKQRELREKESRLEKPNLGIGSGFSRVVGAVTAPVRSIFDQILDFFGLIALGILVQNLPKIIAKIEEFFNSDFIKTVGSILSTIGTGLQKLGELIGIIPKQKQNEIDQDLKSIEREVDDGLKSSDQADRDTRKLEQQLNGLDSEPKQEAPTPEPAPQLMAPGSMYPVQPQQQTPSITPPTTTTPRSASPAPQKFSKGGTVQSTNDQQTKPAYNPGKSGPLKRAERNMGNGFTDFSSAVNNISQSVEQDEKNMMAFAEMSKHFREWSSLTGKASGAPGSPGPGPGPDPGTDPGSPGQEFPYESPTGDATIEFYGGQGRDASGEPGVDFSFKDYKNNYSLFAGEVIDTPVYSGYGQSLRIRSKDPATGKMFDALYAHFPPGGVKVRVGDKVSPGQFLGPVGWDHKNNRPIRGAGNMTGPHTSVDFFEPGTLTRYSNASGVVSSVIKRKGKPPTGTQASKIKPAQVIPAPKGIKLEPVSQDPISSGASKLLDALQRPGGGGDRRLNRSSSSGNQSLFIYAVQPVETFVPFPYPVPMQQTASSTPSRAKLPSIWRA